MKQSVEKADDGQNVSCSQSTSASSADKSHAMKGIRKKDETADLILQRIRSAQLEALAHAPRPEVTGGHP